MFTVVVFLAGVVAGAGGLAIVHALRIELAWWRVRDAVRPERLDLRDIRPAKEPPFVSPETANFDEDSTR